MRMDTNDRRVRNKKGCLNTFLGGRKGRRSLGGKEGRNQVRRGRGRDRVRSGEMTLRGVTGDG